LLAVFQRGFVRALQKADIVISHGILSGMGKNRRARGVGRIPKGKRKTVKGVSMGRNPINGCHPASRARRTEIPTMERRKIAKAATAV